MKLKILFLIFFCAGLAYAEEPKKIVAFGDSLTSGHGLAAEDSFPVKLQAALINKGKNVQVINMGVAGETTADAINRIDSVIAQKPDLVIVEFGSNDMFRHVPAVTAKKNLEQVIEKLKNNNIKILLAPVKFPPVYNPEYYISFYKIYAELADKYDVPVSGSFLEGVAGRREFNQPDAIHPNKNGVDIIVKNILPFVLKALK